MNKELDQYYARLPIKHYSKNIDSKTHNQLDSQIDQNKESCAEITSHTNVDEINKKQSNAIFIDNSSAHLPTTIHLQSNCNMQSVLPTACHRIIQKIGNITQ